jgi:hypothetical protein
MKTLSLLTIMILMLVSNHLQAQVTFGLRAGLNLADMNGKTAGKSQGNLSSIKPGFHLGATVDIDLGKSLFLQPALLYSSKGCIIQSGALGFNDQATINVNYWEVPLNIGVKLDNSHIYVGPYVGFEASSNTKINNNVGPVNLRKTDAGINFGVGFESKNLVISAQYSRGLVNLELGGNINNSTYNSVISMSLGYKFRKKQ